MTHLTIAGNDMCHVDETDTLPLSAVLVLSALLVLAVGFSISLFTADESQPDVGIYLNPDANVICFTHKGSIDCLPYNDEGTHLEVVP